MRKKLIITIAVALVLAVACFALLKLDKPQTNDNTVNDNSISLFSVSVDDISKVSVKSADFNYFVEKNNDSWIMDSDLNKKLSLMRVSEFIYSVSDINADKLISTDEKNGEFGFETSKSFIEIETNEKVSKFILGSKTSSDSFYFKNAENDEIYEISSYEYSSIFKEPDSLRNTELLSIDYLSLVDFSINRNDVNIHLKYKTDEEVELEGKTLNRWKMVSPFTKDCSTSSLQTEVFDKISEIVASGFYTSNSGEYSKYGLDNPKYVIKTKDKNDKINTIKLGNETENEVYVLINDDKTVYGVSKSIFSYRDVNPLNIIDSTIYVKSIDLIDKITISQPDKETVMEIRGEDKKTYFVNGKKAFEKPFKSAYQNLLSMFIRGKAEGADGEQICKIVFYLKNGSRDTISYYKSGDRYSNVYVNNVKDFYVLAEDVETMLENIDKFAKNPIQ